MIARCEGCLREGGESGRSSASKQCEKGVYPVTIFLPPLREDQSLFSLVAEYGLRTQVYSWPLLLRELFGYNATFSSALLYNLNHVAAQTQLSLGLSGIELARLTTLAPYYTAYATREQEAVIWRELLTRAAGRKPSFLMKAIRRRRSLGICNECIAEDTSKGRSSYFRRRHQIPGVLFCDRHQKRLREIPYCIGQATPWPVLLRQSRGREFVPVDLRHEEVWQKVAAMSGAILTAGSNWKTSQRLPVDRAKQIEHFREGGFGIGHSRLRAETLRQSFVNAFGHETLAALGILPTVSGNWLEARLAGRQRGLAPLAETLITAFCELTARRVGHSWPTCVSNYASHGRSFPVGEVVSRDTGFYATCACGMSFSYRSAEDLNAQRFEVNVYGPAYEQVARERFHNGCRIAQIARDMAVAETNVRRWVKRDRSPARIAVGATTKLLLNDEWRLLCIRTGGAGEASRKNTALWRFNLIQSRSQQRQS